MKTGLQEDTKGMEKMETKALNVFDCKSVGRSLKKKFCRESVMHKICSENDAGQVFPGGAGKDGPSLKKLWVRHNPEHSQT